MEIKTHNNNINSFSFMWTGIAENNLSTCLLSNEKILKGEKIVRVVAGGNKYSSRQYRNVKFDVFKKEILKLIEEK